MLSTTSTVSNESGRNPIFRPLYHYIEDMEPLERYGSGGYHPVLIGDRFQDRYQVVQKLGYCAYSTVWLSRDDVCNRHVALKICTADSNPHELTVLSDLSNSRQPSNQSLGKAMMPSVLDAFKIEGVNGTHACYVTHPARMSLDDAKDASYDRLFTLEVARALAAQLTVAVDYIHAQGLVHGDIRCGNVLAQLPPRFECDLDMKPETVTITRRDGEELSPCIPHHAIIPIWLGTRSDKLELPEARILLSDFGEAFYPEKEKKFESRTPLGSRAPESRFELVKPLSFPSDIWSLACSIWEIIGQRSLIDEFMADADDITRQYVDILGILPPEWWNAWKARGKKFSQDGKPINRERDPYQSWEDWFEYCVQKPREAERMPRIEPAERDALFSMLKSMLSFKPEDRPSAKEVLESEWMVKWALPECEKVWKSGIQS
ncbi:hypothetical protein N7456_000526 [Penicillium angulare]|uniref:non-specific serine/threonine protein kinase n=1 Tax=Penicillium angulare TaxID=116970 RepID=A0A9W9KRZ2_9EURO|nr:hypothetical protein N7456_000526 [Penicillium angulare]